MNPATKILWIIVGLSAVLAFIRWFQACLKLRRLREWHHIYIGLILMAIPPLPDGWGVLSVALWALGWWIAWDDAHLHKRQADRWTRGDRPLTGADDGDSFWHRLAHRYGVI